MALNIRATFLEPGTGGIADPSKLHLMVCLQVKDDNVILVPIISKHSYSDGTCSLAVGDHPFVQRPSCADYSRIKKCSKTALESQIAAGTYKCFDDVSLALYVRLLEGVIASDETEKWALDTMLAAGLKERIAAFKKVTPGD